MMDGYNRNSKKQFLQWQFKVVGRMKSKVLNYQVDTFRSSFFSLQMYYLCFLSIILFWLNITVFNDGIPFLALAKCTRLCSVKQFWERLRVAMAPKAVIILATASSDSLFLMNLTVLTLLPLRNQQICRMVASPSSALVRSKVSRVSLQRAQSIFSIFQGTLMFFNFFLGGRYIFYCGSSTKIADDSLDFQMRVLLLDYILAKYFGSLMLVLQNQMVLGTEEAKTWLANRFYDYDSSRLQS